MIGAWICPTRNRVHTNVPQLFKAVLATGMTTPAILAIDKSDWEANKVHYEDLKLPPNWVMMVVEGGSSGEAFEQAREAIPSVILAEPDWVGFLSDDLVPETPGWDTKLLEHVNGTNVVSSNDGAAAPRRMNGAIVWSADLIKSVGYVYPPGLKHMMIDDLWEELGRETGVWYCDMSVMVRHQRQSTKGFKDETYKRAEGFYVPDNLTFSHWKRNEKAAAINRIIELLGQHGATLVRPDFGGKRIMLATPVGDGKFEGVFQRSYVATRDAVRQYGGDLIFCQAPYISEVSLARSKLFGAFLRSDCDLLFFIDADQGWQTKDFIRLLMLSDKYDCVAAAGVRKVEPPSFAVNNTDDFGNPRIANHAAVDGLIEVSHVGFAFVCLTREWAVRMSQSYPELAYVGADGLEDWDIFTPMVLNRRRLGEDFAACQRWRQIGGKVYVAPEINLEHVGAKIWTGAWLDALAEAAQRERAQAA